MKTIALGLAAIALLPLPAIAKPYSEPTNAPACYMITSSGRMINLNYMCNPNAPKTAETAYAIPEITADDVCAELARRRYEAKNQFQYDEAQKGLDICNKDRATVEWAVKYKVK